MKITALIMAGGRGERFWPRSRVSLPKQFLNITDETRTMIQLTVQRIAPVVKPEDVFVITNRAYEALAKEQLCSAGTCGVPSENILYEPCARNTAPAIALGAGYIQKKYGESLLMVLPSDSLIVNDEKYLDVLKKAVTVAEAGDFIATIGIMPSSPETGYGYIQYDTAQKTPFTPDVHRVVTYVEKPDLKTAESYLAAGNYLWNSGQFIMKTSLLLSSVKQFEPDVYNPVDAIVQSAGTSSYRAVLEEQFPKCKSISIDYAVMEKSKNLYTVEGTFGWDDVGSWNAISRIKKTDAQGNTRTGNAVLFNCNNCIIEGKEKLIAAVGLDDVIVVDTDDVLLLCKSSQSENIKKILEIMKSEHNTQYL